MEQRAAAYKFVILLGITSLFADMAYESARSINGAYLQVLGANAATVGFVAGFGELVGYAIRLVSGYMADKTGRYWTITIVGYCINLIPVPLLALTGNWQLAAFFIILERFGRALRIPPRDAMLSHAGHKLGVGWAFGLHEALDRTGAMIGPLIIAVLLFKKDSYVFIYGILAIPVCCALIALLIAYKLFPTPRNLEIGTGHLETKGLNRMFWVYLAGACLLAAGYADFSLMAYHFSKAELFSIAYIPLSYALAMGISALAAPWLGYLYDRKGFIVLIIISVIAIGFAPLVFLGDSVLAFLGVLLWGLGTVANDSLMRAIVAHMAPVTKRASAYGIFNLGYGIAWFVGSVILGVLYDINIVYLVIFAVVAQLLALPFFLIVGQSFKQQKSFKE